MKVLNRTVAELRDLCEVIVSQFRRLDLAVANGPHAELSQQELHVIEYLGDNGPRKMSDLAELLGLKGNSITTLVDNLELRGLVNRHRSLQDRRVVNVELTETGQAAYQSALAEKMQVLRGMLAALTQDEQEIFMVLFRKIARACQSQVESIAPSA
jgi:DNA-binding MarR family transcriptional regulator